MLYLLSILGNYPLYIWLKNCYHIYDYYLAFMFDRSLLYTLAFPLVLSTGNVLSFPCIPLLYLSVPPRVLSSNIDLDTSQVHTPTSNVQSLLRLSLMQFNQTETKCL